MAGRAVKKFSPALVGVESRTDAQGNKRYRGTVYDRRIKKHRHGPWTKLLAEARSWRIDAQAALRSGPATGATEETIRAGLRRFFADMRSGVARTRSGTRYKPSVVRQYEAAYGLYIDRELGPAQVGDIRRRDLQEIADKLSLAHSGSTVRNALMPLRAYFRWAMARDLVYANPTAGLEVPANESKRERVATPVEADALLRALPEKDRPIWASFFYAGLRVGEVQGLKIEDLDLEENLINIRRGWDPKEGFIEPKSAAGKRVVPIPAVLHSLLVAHLRSLDRSGGLVFGRSADAAFTPQSLTQRADRIWKKKGLKRITPHEARHTYASLMISAMKRDEALNPKVLSTIMGHSSIAITYDRYGHLLPGSEAKAGAALDAYLDDVPTAVPTRASTEAG